MFFYNEYKKCETDVVYFVEKYLNIKLYPWQRGMLWNYQRNDHFIVNACRQSGKTLILKYFAIWYAMFHDNKTIGFMSPNSLCNDSVNDHIRSILDGFEVEVDKMSKSQIILKNNSTIDFMSATQSLYAPCGRAYDLFIFDEPAFYRSYEPITAILPTLSRGGAKVLLASTKNKEDDFFYSLYKDSKNSYSIWKSMSVNWWDFPEFQETKYRKMLGEEIFNREYLSDF